MLKIKVYFYLYYIIIFNKYKTATKVTVLNQAFNYDTLLFNLISSAIIAMNSELVGLPRWLCIV